MSFFTFSSQQTVASWQESLVTIHPSELYPLKACHHVEFHVGFLSVSEMGLDSTALVESVVSSAKASVAVILVLVRISNSEQSKNLSISIPFVRPSS